MAKLLVENVPTIVVNTGNILSLYDITKNPGQNPTEELVEAIRITINEFLNCGGVQAEPGQPLEILRQNDDSADKIAEYDPNELKIGFKIFLNSDEEEFVTAALDKAFSTLNINTVHNVIISFNQKRIDIDQNETTANIQNIWRILERYVRNKKIHQIGISDIEENVFRVLYDWANVKPSIIQINLATCCVVPPSLQLFCKENEIQLLTHSDPNEILPESFAESIFDTPLGVNWVVRFLVHIKCRGVLTVKGYLTNLVKK